MPDRQRRCIVTGEVKEVGDLVRFVVGPDGAVVPDVAGDLPGRGLWLSAEREVVEAAARKGLFARAARRQVRVGDDLVDLTERCLRRRCLDLLGLARRAGVAALGAENVRALARSGRLKVLLGACDGAAAARARLGRLAAGAPIVGLFSVAELSLALGREYVVHAALASSGLTDRFIAETARLARFNAVGGLDAA